MNVILLSDLHLTTWFNPRKFEYLKNIILPADQIILAGDIWDGHRCSFDSFIKSRWSELFPLLLDRDAIYLYGNHDLEEWGDERVNLFSARQAQCTKLKAGKFTYLIEHGHEIAPSPDVLHPWINDVPLGGYVQYAVLELIPVPIFGDLYLNRRAQRATRLLKAAAQSRLDDGEILVCGHNHLGEVDLSSRYANCGFMGLGRASHLKIENGEPTLVQDRY